MKAAGWKRGALAIFAYTVVAFLVVPLLIVIPLSFTPGTVFAFPPEGFSLRWYEDYLSEPRWLKATWLSIRLGIVVALVSTSLGFLSALAVNQYLRGGRTVIRALLVAPLIVPPIITAVAIFDIYSRVGLVRTFPGLVIAHAILALPFSFLVLESALRGLDTGPLEAARSLGATTGRAWWEVGLPSLAPALRASLIFSFLISWDEIVLTVFIGGVRLQTLPLRMYEFISTQIRPTLAAISALIVIVIMIGMVLGYIRMRRRRRREEALAAKDRLDRASAMQGSAAITSTDHHEDAHQ